MMQILYRTVLLCTSHRALARGFVYLLCLVLMFASAGTVRAAGSGTLDRVSGWFAAGSNVTVTAAAGSYSVFGSWSGNTNSCVISGSQIAIPVSGPRSISAVFVLKKTSKGTAELWLSSYSQTNGTPDQAELLDGDGDGAAAWQEYIAGTDPTNRNDCFQVMLSSSNGLPMASFRTIVATSNYYGSLSRHYALEQLGNLTNTNWTIVPGYSNRVASGATIFCTNSISTNTLYYRAKAWLQ